MKSKIAMNLMLLVLIGKPLLEASPQRPNLDKPERTEIPRVDYNKEELESLYKGEEEILRAIKKYNDKG